MMIHSTYFILHIKTNMLVSINRLLECISTLKDSIKIIIPTICLIPNPNLNPDRNPNYYTNSHPQFPSQNSKANTQQNFNNHQNPHANPNSDLVLFEIPFPFSPYPNLHPNPHPNLIPSQFKLQLISHLNENPVPIINSLY